MNINQMLEQIDIELGSMLIDNLTKHQMECFRKIDGYLHDIEQLLGQSYCYFEEDEVVIKRRNRLDMNKIKDRITNNISTADALKDVEPY